MKVPIQVNNAIREAQITYLAQHEFGFVEEWRECLENNPDPVRTDAVDFAALACKRFLAHAPIEAYARRAGDIPASIRTNAECEVANLVALKSRWFSDSDVLGIAHFRRTWSNNLVLDYLAVHPWIGRPPPGRSERINGAGTALLYFLSSVARQNACGCIWGETTPSSCTFYQKVFGLDLVRDLLYIPSKNFIGFAETLEQQWKQSGAMK